MSSVLLTLITPVPLFVLLLTRNRTRKKLDCRWWWRKWEDERKMSSFPVMLFINKWSTRMRMETVEIVLIVAAMPGKKRQKGFGWFCYSASFMKWRDSKPTSLCTFAPILLRSSWIASGGRLKTWITFRPISSIEVIIIFCLSFLPLCKAMGYIRARNLLLSPSLWRQLLLLTEMQEMMSANEFLSPATPISNYFAALFCRYLKSWGDAAEQRDDDDAGIGSRSIIQDSDSSWCNPHPIALFADRHMHRVSCLVAPKILPTSRFSLNTDLVPIFPHSCHAPWLLSRRITLTRGPQDLSAFLLAHDRKIR